VGLRLTSLSVEPLRPEDVPSLRLLGSSYLQESVRRYVLQHPNFAFWVPETRDYILGAYWRGRREIGLIVEAVGGTASLWALAQRAKEAFAEADCRAVVLSDAETDRHESFYLSMDWQVLEEMYIMERDRQPIPVPSPQRITLRPFTPQLLDPLMEVDHRAFPWLWWNDPDDFLAYSQLAEVFVLTAWVRGRLMGYTSCTVRQGRGHLDRIAIDPDFEGQGYGSELLSLTLLELERRGAYRVGLNTQATNHRAQRLYRRFGFWREPRGFRIIGTWLDDPPPNATMASAPPPTKEGPKGTKG
jgi:ribosomal protein S18 acetylase RimI-like enzyme